MSLEQWCIHVILFHVKLQVSESESDSSEESAQFWSLVLGGAQVAQIYVDLYLDKNPPRISNLSGMGWLMETIRNAGECHRQLRMNEKILMDLHDLLVGRYGLKPSMHMNTLEMLAILLYTLGGNESNRRAQNRFNHSGETISRKFDEVLLCLIAMAKDFIRPKNPNFPTVHKRIRDDRHAYPHFKDCIGALDGTHICVALSPEEMVRYIGKTRMATQNVLAVCDFDMRFTYVSTGQPGAMHDTSVLYNAIRVDEEFFPHPPQGKYYVVDAGYPNRPGYLAPYKGERYHLPEWHRGMEPKTPAERFNRVHSSIRNVIERSFGLLKMKWQILYKMPPYPMYKQKMIVVATMVLHNYIREHGGEDIDFDRFDRDPNYIPTIPERYNKYAVSPLASDGSTSNANAPTMDVFRDELATALSLAWN
nr:putative nuclease HARBI1 isoform X1 [Setaria viridis]